VFTLYSSKLNSCIIACMELDYNSRRGREVFFDKLRDFHVQNELFDKLVEYFQDKVVVMVDKPTFRRVMGESSEESAGEKVEITQFTSKKLAETIREYVILNSEKTLEEALPEVIEAYSVAKSTVRYGVIKPEPGSNARIATDSEIDTLRTDFEREIDESSGGMLFTDCYAEGGVDEGFYAESIDLMENMPVDDKVTSEGLRNLGLIDVRHDTTQTNIDGSQFGNRDSFKEGIVEYNEYGDVTLKCPECESQIVMALGNEKYQCLLCDCNYIAPLGLGDFLPDDDDDDDDTEIIILR
jgi:hypothetical protein